MSGTIESNHRDLLEARSILLVDSDKGLCSLLSQFLLGHGFCVRAEHDGTQGSAQSFQHSFDLIVLDLTLPVLDGFGVLREIRTRSSVPVLLLTKCEEDCVASLDAGADDFVLKPFGPGELLARIYGVLRRTGKAVTRPASIFRCDNLCLNVETHEAWLSGHPLELTNIEFVILKCLIRSPGRIVSRDELTAVLYQRQSTPFDRSIDVHISRVRKKTEWAGRRFIRTIRGIGYLFAPLQRQGE